MEKYTNKIGQIKSTLGVLKNDIESIKLVNLF